MFNLNSKNNFKALAIGCAAVLICASAQMFAGSYNSVYAETVSVNKTVSCKDEANHTIKGLKPSDLVGATGTLKTITCTFKTSTGEIPKAFSGAYGVAVSLDCPDATDEYWYQADTVEFDSSTIKDNGDGTFSVTYNVPASVQKYINCDPTWGNLEIGCYYCDIDSVTLISVSDSATSSSTPSTTTKTPSVTTPSTPTTPSTSGTTVSSTYEVKNNEDGTNTGVVHVDTTGLSTGTVTVTFTGGTPGATTSGEVGYYDNATQKWVGKYDTWEEQKFDANGNLSISVKVPTDVEDVQIMLTYYADWSSGSESLLNKNSIKATVSTSGTVTPSNPSNPTTPSNPSNPSQSMPSDAQCGWTDITSGTTATNSSNLISSSSATGTKTVTINQGGQWSSYDEGNEAIILDQTYEAPLDENGNPIYDTDSGNDVITNSNNFMFVDDFNIPSNAEFNHFRFTFESDEPMYQVQFGAGISVEKDSDIANSGSTDTNGNISKIWFNESGTYDPSNEDDYASLENANGKKYYGFNALDTYAGGTNYIQAQWDVYDDVKPYIQNDAWSSVSVQYWYGVDPADWDAIDWENPPENPDIEHKPSQIKVTEATANYNITETYDYTDTATKSVDLEAFDNMTGVPFSDLGLTGQDKPKAVTITVSGASDLGKLVGAFGVSVTDDYSGTDLESDNWYQSSNLAYEDCGSTYEITWIIPSNIADFVNPEYGAEIKFGAWYAGAGENALSSVKITNISVDYYTDEDVTTTPADTTTTPADTTTTPADTTTTPVDTTTTPADTTTSSTASGEEPLWGDVNVDGFVKSNDLLLLKKYLLGLDDVSEQGLINADVTHDTPSAVKSNDLLKLKKFLLGLIDDLGPGSEN